ncbi:hypothetical protein Tco_1254496, partial [Tanacetum coccineum]
MRRVNASTFWRRHGRDISSSSSLRYLFLDFQCPVSTSSLSEDVFLEDEPYSSASLAPTVLGVRNLEGLFTRGAPFSASLAVGVPENFHFPILPKLGVGTVIFPPPLLLVAAVVEILPSSGPKLSSGLWDGVAVFGGIRPWHRFGEGVVKVARCRPSVACDCGGCLGCPQGRSHRCEDQIIWRIGASRGLLRDLSRGLVALLLRLRSPLASDEELEEPMEDQPLPADASSTAPSSGYIADFDSKEDEE